MDNSFDSSGKSDDLERRLREIIFADLVLGKEKDSIDDKQPMFGEGGLGLDRVDELQIIVSVRNRFGVELPENFSGDQHHLRTIGEIAEYIRNSPRGLVW